MAPEKNKSNGIVDQHILEYKTLTNPHDLKRDLPQTDKAKETVRCGRKAIKDILDGKDSRTMIIIGPCSIHDTKSAEEYATKLKELSNKVSDKFLIIMRTYFEKPRTSIGWKGFIYDPDLNGLNDINKGLHLSREILLHNAGIGLPSATEYLEAFTPQYNSDLISWAAIGARTVESPQHRQLASGLSMPVGFKNGTEGNIKVAINAMLSARERHSFLGINELGAPCIVNTSGNPYTHLVLRGGDRSTNYDEKNVKEAQTLLKAHQLSPKLMIDCNHGNSKKDHGQQVLVFKNIIQQIKDGNKGIIGIMIESNLNSGNQPIPKDLDGFDSTKLEYGTSVTDACIDWETTESLLLDAYRTLGK